MNSIAFFRRRYMEVCMKAPTVVESPKVPREW